MSSFNEPKIVSSSKKLKVAIFVRFFAKYKFFMFSVTVSDCSNPKLGHESAEKKERHLAEAMASITNHGRGNRDNQRKNREWDERLL